MRRIPKLLVAALPVLCSSAACVPEATSPQLPAHIASLGVASPISTAADLAKVMRASYITMQVSPRGTSNFTDLSPGLDYFDVDSGINGAAPFEQFFASDGAIAIIQPDPAGSNAPSIHLVAVSDADAFAAGAFAGDEQLLIRREYDMISPRVSTLRIVTPPGYVPRPDGGPVQAHSDWSNFLPAGYQQNGAFIVVKPPANVVGFEWKAQLGAVSFIYDGERLHGQAIFERGVLLADYPGRIGQAAWIQPAGQASTLAVITFDVFAIDLANMNIPAAPGNFGLTLTAQVPIGDYPFGARDVAASGNLVAFGSGDATGVSSAPIAYVVDMSDAGTTGPVVYPVPGSASIMGRVVLQPPLLFAPDEGAILQLIGAPPFDPFGTSGGTRSEGGMQVFDISNLAAPAQVSVLHRAAFGTGAENMLLSGSDAFLFLNGPLDAPPTPNSENALFGVASVTDPATPVMVALGSAYDLGLPPSAYPPLPVNYANDGAIWGNTIYVACEDFGVVAFDITDPVNLHELWNIAPPLGPIASVTGTPDGKYLLTTEESHGGPLRIWALGTTPTTPPTEVATWLDRPSGMLHYVTVDGTNAYVAGFGEGLHVLDISNPSAPTEIARYVPRGFDGFSQTTDYFRGEEEGVIGVAVTNNAVYITDTEEGLFAFQKP